ncbi:MAG: ATP-binding protein [Elainellaceae cyanobacterium]
MSVRAMDDLLRVLIVDDDEADRMAIRRTLRPSSLPLTIEEATDAASAIAMIQHQTFHWVLLDYRLPDLDGLSLVKQLRQLNVTIPLIVLTGQGDEQVAVEVMKAGASDYLTKGRMSPEELSRLLHSSLRLYQAEQQTLAANEKLRETNELLRKKNQELEVQQRKIEQQNGQIIEAYRLKSEFLATMSHELRTPLNAILGFSQVLENQARGLLNDYQIEVVRRIFSNGKSLLALVNDILDLSKIEAQQFTLKPAPVDLKKFALMAVAELKSLAERKDLELQTHIELQNCIIQGDERCLRRVLVNLIANAIKFTDSGFVRLQLTDLDAEHIEICVQDSGIGMSPDQLPYIFELFHQADQSLRRRHSGTGLGLAITSSMVQMMNGEISVESVEGEGSTFRVRIPRQ